jgi:transposase
LCWLGHLVVGFDNYRTSKGCQICFSLLDTHDDKRDRVKECTGCGVVFPRDPCSGQLIARLAEMEFNGEESPSQFLKYFVTSLLIININP